MHKKILKIAALLGALAVVLGAFGSHGLKALLNEEALNTFETAVRYQMYHVFALIAVGVLYKDFSGKYLRWSGYFLIIGIAIFSGSLYLLTAVRATGNVGFNWLGVITPIGGLCLITGWVLILVAISGKR